MNRLIKSLCTLFPLLGMVSCSSNSGSPKFFSVDERPSNIIIGPGPINPPGPTDPPLPDGSTDFIDAVEICIGDSAIDDYQWYGDVDYYGFYAIHTNYIYFNIEFGAGDFGWYYSIIEFYHEVDNVPVLVQSFSNDIISLNLSILPPLYVEGGEYYYFKVYQDQELVDDPGGPISMLRSDEPDVIRPRYYAKLSYANGTDKTWDEYPTSGYLLGYNYAYLDDYIVYVCFSENASNEYQNSQHTITYRDIFLEAMCMWNSVGVIQFVETTSYQNCDIFAYASNLTTNRGLYDPIEVDGNNAIVRANIWVSDYYFYDVDYRYCLKTAVHEFGHSIGLSHLTCDYYNNYMNTGAFYLDGFGRGDIDLYRYLYGD